MSSIFEVTLPQLAESQVSSAMERLYKSQGDHIDDNDPNCDINTDKCTYVHTSHDPV